MLTIFANVVLPVFLVAGLGYLLKRRLDVPVPPLNQTVLYVLMPAFIFTSLLPVDFRSEEPLRITAFAFLLALVMLLIGFAVARAARLDRPTANALALTAALPNLGNYGLSVVLLAFGQPGLAAGTLLLAVQMLYGLALAVFVASSGSAPLGRALAEVLRQPVIYAVAAALALNLTGIAPPQFVMSALALPSQAAIPVMLIVLGMNVATTSGVERPGLVALATFVRLVVGTLVGWLLAIALGIEGVARDVMIVGAAMPTAVFTILTATQFDARPKFVSDVVVVSTLASILTVTAVLALLSGTLGPV
ncbi:MAG TPA: AEC family transporter [Candidatus Limnocylindria bacterium]|nr:AEC family transporter [Candidatus Limnocylindria bacterium]